MENPRLLPEYEKPTSIQKGDSFTYQGQTHVCIQNTSGMVLWNTGRAMENKLIKIEK